MCKFSIIVPCYNIEKRIEPLFVMLNSKKFNNYEVILIDDCSKDNSYNKMLEYAERYDNYIVIKTPQNGGPGIARNCGLDCAKGEYIIFVDSDDYMDVSVLNDIDLYLMKNSNVDMLVFPYQVERGKKTTIVDNFSDFTDGQCIEKERVVLGNMAPWAKVYKRSIIEEYMVRFPDRKIGEDICFVVNYISKVNNIFKGTRSYYKYIISKNSITHKKDYDLTQKTTFELLQPIYAEFFPKIEINMFVNNHLLTKAKLMCSANVKAKDIKNWFIKENKKYPDWINKVDYNSQSFYKRLIYKAMYNSNAKLIKFIMFIRRILY